MAKQRCKDTTLDSFYGHFLYQQKVPEEHFLRKLDEVIDWSLFTRRLLCTLTWFKNRLLRQGGREAYEKLFNEVIVIAQENSKKRAAQEKRMSYLAFLNNLTRTQPL